MNECTNKMLANPQNYFLHNHHSLETMNERKCCTFAKIFNKSTIKSQFYIVLVGERNEEEKNYWKDVRKWEVRMREQNRTILSHRIIPFLSSSTTFQPTHFKFSNFFSLIFFLLLLKLNFHLFNHYRRKYYWIIVFSIKLINDLPYCLFLSV